LDSFFEKAKVSISLIDEKIKSIDEKYSTLLIFFGDNVKDMPMETFIEIFSKFNRDLGVKIYFIINK